MTWKVIEKREEASPLLGFIGYFAPLSKDARRFFGVDLDPVNEFKNRSARMVLPLEKWLQIEKTALAKLADRKFVRKMKTGLMKAAQALKTLGEELQKTNFKNKTNLQLGQLFEKTLKSIMNFSTYCHWINASDFEYHLLSKKLTGILEKHTKNNVHKIFAILTTPTKDILQQKQDKDILKILKTIKKERADSKNFAKNPKIKKLLAAHTKKYRWLLYEQEGDPLTTSYFTEIIADALKSGLNPGKELAQTKRKREKLITEKKQWLKKLKLSGQEKYWFGLAAKIVYLKLYIREIKVRAYCQADGLMKEIAKRLRLNKFQVRHLMPQELKKALKTGKVDVEVLNKRIKHCVLYFKKGQVKVFTGQKAKQWSAKFTEETPAEQIQEIHGTSANPGQARGMVKQVLSPKDMKKFKKGDILVAYMTDPGVVPAMKKAGAIVTDVGGITCHAAIVSREFDIPCIIGTKIATQVLKDGMMVEVDANRGIVRKI